MSPQAVEVVSHFVEPGVVQRSVAGDRRLGPRLSVSYFSQFLALNFLTDRSLQGSLLLLQLLKAIQQPEIFQVSVEIGFHGALRLNAATPEALAETDEERYVLYTFEATPNDLHVALTVANEINCPVGAWVEALPILLNNCY